MYAATAARLVAQLYAVTGDYGAAQDAVQEAFVRVLTRPGWLRQLDNPEAWLRTVALNVARSQHRRRVLLDRILSSGRLDRPPALDLSPDRIALVAALQRLPRAVRETIVLHHIGDLAVTEVAGTLGCSVSAVKSRLMRGRQALAEYLTEHDRPAEPGHLPAERPTATVGAAPTPREREIR